MILWGQIHWPNLGIKQTLINNRITISVSGSNIPDKNVYSFECFFMVSSYIFKTKVGDSRGVPSILWAIG